jgi:hypothetical protein
MPTLSRITVVAYVQRCVQAAADLLNLAAARKNLSDLFNSMVLLWICERHTT